MVECCKFVSTTSFSCSTLCTRATCGIIFVRIVSLSQGTLNINLDRSPYTALSHSWFTHMRCASLRVSFPLKFLPLQMLPNSQPIPALPAHFPWSWKGLSYSLLPGRDLTIHPWLLLPILFKSDPFPTNIHFLSPSQFP